MKITIRPTTARDLPRIDALLQARSPEDFTAAAGDGAQPGLMELAEDIFDESPAEEVADDLPPPAYQPKVAAFEPRREDAEDEADLEEFVAPRAPGTPSPEAMARLR